MTAATVYNPGQDNGAGDVNALFLKVFGGEVLTAFQEVNVMMDKQMVRTIQHGKSAQFPATWKVNSSYHTAGAEIVGQSGNVSERVITIDDLLIADVFIDVLDDAMNHWDVSSVLSNEAGRELSYAFDKNSQQVGVLAARAAATVTGGNGGGSSTNAGYGTTGSTIATGIFLGAQTLDEKDVPENDRYAVMRPAKYYLVAQTTDVINRDWGGAGVYSEGEVLKVAGIHIVKSNHLPETNITTGPTAYQGNFATTTQLIFQKGAMGTVKLLDLSMSMDWDFRRRGHLIVAQYALGHGILRPECAFELKTA